jgi:hypothetical protein
MASFERISESVSQGSDMQSFREEFSENSPERLQT